MHHCHPSAKCIEDAEHNLFEENEPPLFPDSPSPEIPNELANTLETIVAIASNQDSTSVTENADLTEVSSERAKLRTESYKHLQK